MGGTQPLVGGGRIEASNCRCAQSRRRRISSSNRLCSTSANRLRTVATASGQSGEFDVDAKRFPNRNVRDPYRRLGISRDASAEEVSEARNFLVLEYALDEAGVESIERAHDKILRDKFHERRKSRGLKLGKQRSRRKSNDPPMPGSSALAKAQAMLEVPDRTTLMRRVFLYSLLAMWSVYQSSSSGPAFQVLLAFGACVWLLSDKRKRQGTNSLSTGWWWPGKSFWQSTIALLSGFIAGAVLPVLFPVLLPKTVTPEFITAQCMFISCFVCATFLK